MFWISYGQLWCSKYHDSALKNLILTDAHSPGEFRVLGPLSNNHDFAKDFNCPVGSRMNPADKCEVW
jgi:predicted metalloendopeptidase